MSDDDAPPDELEVIECEGSRIFIGVAMEDGQVRFVVRDALPGINITFDLEPWRALELARKIIRTEYATLQGGAPKRRHHA